MFQINNNTAKHQYSDLIEVFNRCFANSHNTQLIQGEDEPLYLPADSQISYHRIIFAHGFYASALHEIAHWCIAGVKRRQQVDFGYWYCPDGRTSSQQQAFETLEIKPQALEWLFCLATNFPFNVSCDNLSADIQPDRLAFQRRVQHQVIQYLQQGIPLRAGRFIEGLRHFYQSAVLTEKDFLAICV